MLVLPPVAAIYILLGGLYEDLAHSLAILSMLPFAEWGRCWRCTGSANGDCSRQQRSARRLTAFGGLLMALTLYATPVIFLYVDACRAS